MTTRHQKADLFWAEAYQRLEMRYRTVFWKAKSTFKIYWGVREQNGLFGEEDTRICSQTRVLTVAVFVTIITFDFQRLKICLFNAPR